MNKIIVITIFCLFIGGLIGFRNKYNINSAWDWYVIIEISKTGNILGNGYLQNYNNNLFPVQYLIFWKNLFPAILNNNYFYLTLSTIVATYIVSYLIIRKILNRLDSIVVILVAMTWLPLYWYAQVAYTDTLVVMYVALFIYFGFEKNFKLTKNKIKWLAMLIIGTLALLIKITSIIILIAYLMVAIFKASKRQIIIVTSIILMSLFLTSQVKNILIDQAKLDDNQSFLFWHWINMGHEENVAPGGYNDKNVVETLQINDKTKAEKKAFYINELNQKLSDRGFLNEAKFLIKKLAFTWFDPYFHTNGELRQGESLEQREKNDPFFQSTKIYLFHKIHQNIVYLCLILISVAIMKGKIDNLKIFIISTLIGVVLFLLIWETRSRYLMMFWPTLMILSLSCYLRMNNACKEKIPIANK